MVDIVMPRLSDSMETGTVVRWLKAIGDEIAIGEELVEIETDKATMVYEADTAGTLLELLADEGQTLPVGAAIARIGDVGSEAGDDAQSAPTSRAQGTSASPLATRIANQLGVDLIEVVGTGPRGRIVKADVERAHADNAAREPTQSTADPSSKGSAETIELSTLQRTVARRMAESTATAPQFALECDVDVSDALELRSRLKASAQRDQAPPTINDMIIKACAIAVQEFPAVNSAYRDGRVEHYTRINIGIAVAAEKALLVPTVFDADGKTLHEIAAETRVLVERARTSTITPAELSGGTFTISNLGMYGITRFAAIINPPQAAILAIGAINQALAVRGRSITLTDRMSLTLTCDHRILYGADAASFLSRLRDLLEHPQQLARIVQ